MGRFFVSVLFSLPLSCSVHISKFEMLVGQKKKKKGDSADDDNNDPMEESESICSIGAAASFSRSLGLLKKFVQSYCCSLSSFLSSSCLLGISNQIHKPEVRWMARERTKSPNQSS